MLIIHTSSINVEFYSLSNTFYFLILCYKEQKICLFLWRPAISRYKCPKKSGQQGSTRHLKVRMLKVKGEAYLRFLQEELPRLLEDVPLNKRGRMYFQNDGALPHSSREVRNFLNYHFPGRWIGRCGPHHWPARSPDLSPLDYCVWGWMKELVYSVKVETRDALLVRILDAADHIRNNQLKLL